MGVDFVVVVVLVVVILGFVFGGFIGGFIVKYLIKCYDFKLEYCDDLFKNYGVVEYN